MFQIYFRSCKHTFDVFFHEPKLYLRSSYNITSENRYNTGHIFTNQNAIFCLEMFLGVGKVMDSLFWTPKNWCFLMYIEDPFSDKFATPKQFSLQVHQIFFFLTDVSFQKKNRPHIFWKVLNTYQKFLTSLLLT